MAAAETESAPAVGALDRPADREIVRLVRWSGDDDRFEPPVIFAKSEPVIIFLPA